ncbi:MAG TPA: hypothetical protein VMW42_06580 [Desulfatiglandales bacterium]|nr:hypothetical protein [Desulfatiglandales bacterium]
MRGLQIAELAEKMDQAINTMHEMAKMEGEVKILLDIDKVFTSQELSQLRTGISRD